MGYVEGASWEEPAKVVQSNRSPEPEYWPMDAWLPDGGEGRDARAAGRDVKIVRDRADDEGERRVIRFSQVEGVLARGCGGCHRAGGATPNLAATGSALYETLITRIATRCSGDRLVLPKDVERSALVAITEGAPTCAVRMPQGCTENSPKCLSVGDMNLIKEWIVQGASQE
jgi:hypothetical protein